MRHRNVIPIGRILGIPIGLDYTWFLIFAVMTWLLAVNYFPAEFHDWRPATYWVMGAVTTIMLFVSVLLHELGHAVVAMRFKVPVRSIRLFIFGGVAEIGAEPPTAWAEFLIAIAGPIVSLVLGGLFLLLKPVVASSEALWGLAKYLAFINLALVVFNLIPGFPLDGGRVFRAIVWAVTHNFRRATVIAATVGKLFGFLFIFLGVWWMFRGDFGNGVWIALIGWFLENAAAGQLQQVSLEGALAGHTVAQAMSRTPLNISGDMTLQQLVDEHILGGARRSFIVTRGENAVGLVTLHRIKEVPRDRWASTNVESVMTPLEESRSIAPDAQVWAALQHMDRDGVNQLPVVQDSRIVGMLSREDVITFLRTLQEVGA